jgi:flavin-dependent dehydrogenase
VIRIQPGADGFLLDARDPGGGTRRVHGRYLVAADGAAGPVHRMLLAGAGATPGPAQFSRSFTTYPRQEPVSRLQIVWFPGRDGYAWMFPRRDHASVGICEQDRRGGNRELRDLLDLAIRQGRLEGRAGAPGVGALIPCYRGDTLATIPVEGRRFALVGDAAGAVDPVSREGIHHAMETGWKLGQHDPLHHPGTYAAWYDAEIRPELLAGSRWAPRFFHPRFLGTMIGALRHSRRLQDVFRDLVTGTETYPGLTRRLLRELPWTVPHLGAALMRNFSAGAR